MSFKVSQREVLVKRVSDAVLCAQEDVCAVSSERAREERMHVSTSAPSTHRAANRQFPTNTSSRPPQRAPRTSHHAPRTTHRETHSIAPHRSLVASRTVGPAAQKKSTRHLEICSCVLLVRYPPQHVRVLPRQPASAQRYCSSLSRYTVVPTRSVLPELSSRHALITTKIGRRPKAATRDLLGRLYASRRRITNVTRLLGHGLWLERR